MKGLIHLFRFAYKFFGQTWKTIYEIYRYPNKNEVGDGKTLSLL